MGQLWKLVTSPFNLMLAYSQIQKNRGALTMGVDKLTPNGIGVETLQELRKDLVNGTYKHKAIKRTYVPEPDSHKKRPMGIPTFRDRIVQAAVKNVLEAIFEPRFKHVEKEQNEIARNYGLRPGQRPQEAILKLRVALQVHVNAIELDIKGAFYNVLHRKVLQQIKTRVQDRRPMALVEQMLKAGIIRTDGKDTSSKMKIPFKGTLQGPIVSPLLWNICFELFDEYVRNELSAYIEEINEQEDRNQRSKRDPKYTQIATQVQLSRSRLKRLHEKGVHPKDEAYQNELATFKSWKSAQMGKKSKIQHNNSKIKMFRFADDVIILHDGKDREVEVIKQKVFEFLKTIGLEASEEKTQIKKTNDVNNPVKFLRFQMVVRPGRVLTKSSPKHKRKVVRTDGNVHRVTQTVELAEHRNKGRTRPITSVRPDISQVLFKLHNRGYCDKKRFPIHSKLLLFKSDFEIVSHYAMVLRGNLQYYAPVVTDTAFLQRMRYILRYSCAKTLANKHKSSISKTFKRLTRRMKVKVQKHHTNFRTGETTLREYETLIPNTTDLIESSRKTWRFNRAYVRYNPYEVSANMCTIMKMTDRCVVCGTHHEICPIEHHHVNSCKSIKAKGWRRFVQMLERKVIPLCKNCRNLAGRGKLNDIKFSDLVAPEVL